MSGRLSRLLGITDVDLHVEEVTGTDKTLDVVVDIFNQVNSGGTKLSKGDLALAKICADWPEARDTMKAKLKEWAKADYHFNLDWLLRSVNTVLTGEAKFQFLHDKIGGRDPERPQACHQAHRHVPQPHQRTARPRPRPGVFRPLRGPGAGALSRPAIGTAGREGARQASVLVRAGGHVGPLLRFNRVVHRPGPRGPRRTRTGGWTSSWTSCGSGMAAFASSRDISRAGASVHASTPCSTCSLGWEEPATGARGYRSRRAFSAR